MNTNIYILLLTYLCCITLSTHCYFYTIAGDQTTISADNDGGWDGGGGCECLLTYGINITYYKFIYNDNNAWTVSLDKEGVLTLHSIISGYKSRCEILFY